MVAPLVHVNGAVNLPSTEAVMRELAARIPNLMQVPDGETEPAERKGFMNFILDKFKATEGLQMVAPEAGKPIEIDTEQVELAPGNSVSKLRFPEIGYAAYYRQSWSVFQRLQHEGVINPKARFQIQYPTPQACVTAFVNRKDALAVLPAFEAALFRDLDLILAHVPHDKIAVQWDLPIEIGALEMPEFFAVSDSQNLDTIADVLAHCIDHVPRNVPVGMHLCYGDAGHRHWKEPTSLKTQVDLINALAVRVTREISWAAFTVPQYVKNADYFSPLAELAPCLIEPYLALVPYHPEMQEPSTTEEQIRLVQKHMKGRRWGVCTECGLSGVTPEEMPAILDLHTAIAKKVAQNLELEI